MSKRFRVAFSFAGATRNYVAAVAEILSQHFGRDAILYDKYHEGEFSRPDLALYLPKLYKEEADLVVGVFCKDYLTKEWCGLEWRAIYSLVKHGVESSLLLSRYDYVEPEGLFGLAGFTNLEKKMPCQFADLILERLASNEGKARDFFKIESKDSTVTDAGVLMQQHSTIDTTIRHPIHNLPKRTYQTLIGREEDLNKLITRLSFDEFYERIITLIGIGGVGKTTLALEAAYAYLDTWKKGDPLNDNFFDLIVFATAQKSRLSPHGITEGRGTVPVRTLQDLCFEIAKVSGQNALKHAQPARLVSKLHQFLSSGNNKTLIILDNLEDIEDEDTHEILEFFRSVKNSKIKVIITTRNSDRYDLNLVHLNDVESAELICCLLVQNNLFAPEEFKLQLQQLSGGIPLAIKYSIGILSLKGDPILALDMIKDPEGDLAVYCFEKLFLILKQDYPCAYRFLLVLSLTPCGFTRSILFDVYEIKQSDINSACESLSQLCRCSLVYQENDFYRLLPLTRHYILSKLEKDLDLSRRVHSSLVRVYVDIARVKGGEDQGEWHHQYDQINKEWGNFRSIFESCLSEGDFLNAKLLWQTLCQFTYLYGYWTDREIWTDRLLELSTKKGDNGFLAEIMSAKAWICLLRETDENLQNAKDLLKNAWNLRQHCNPFVRSTIALNLAVVYTRDKKFKNADYWFIQQHKKVVKDFGRYMLNSQYKRLELRFLLYFAERYYRDSSYDTAFKIYRQVVNKAGKINWLRFKVKAIERMAYLHIINKRYDDAREILDAWYPVMKRNNDIRRIAFFQRDYAELEFQLRNFADASCWAIQAQKIFIDLGMELRSASMKKYILDQ